MSDIVDDGRHLSAFNLMALWVHGAAVIVPVQGTPDCRVRLDPGHGEVALITPYATPEPEVARLRNVSLNSVTVDDQTFAEIAVATADNVGAAYSFLTTVADQLQQRRAPLAAAVASAVALHRDVLAGRQAMTPEKEIGLYGELLVLEHLMSSVGVASAISAWTGPIGEEHDFVLVEGDLEVKTTSTERRQHVIGSLTQLEPRPAVDLRVLSIQVTRTTEAGGRTLARVVADVRATAADHTLLLDRCLASAGWDPDHAAAYATRWTLRSRPLAYMVDEEFPRLTPSLLRQIVQRADAISDVSYRVDLTNLDPVPVASLDGFVAS